MEEWKEYKLGDVCSRLSSGKNISASKISDSDVYPVFGGNGLRGYTDNSNFTGDCAIIGRQGAFCGNVKFFSGQAYMTEHAVVVCGNEKANTRYLSYLLSTMSLGRLSGQSAQPGLAVGTLAKQVIKLPPLPTQQKIAAILSSLDDKIELNNKINTNLEQQAGALFKNWFVDFEPFGGKMPEGWKVGKLSDVLRLKKNPIQPGEDTSLPYLPIDLIPIKSLAIREVRPNEEALSSLLRFEENDILIGAMRVYFHRVAIAPFDGITRTTCFVLGPFNPKYFAYAAIACNQDLAIDYAQKTSKGSTMPYAVWEGGLGDFEIPIPDEVTAEKFNNIVEPFLEQIKKSYFENKNLQELRESLLPKLMNGEIEVGI